MGFSADHTDGPSQTHLPGPNVVTPEPVDEVGIQIADHVKVKADKFSGVPPSHINPFTGFVQSDVPSAAHPDHPPSRP